MSPTSETDALDVGLPCLRTEAAAVNLLSPTDKAYLIHWAPSLTLHSNTSCPVTSKEE